LWGYLPEEIFDKRDIDAVPGLSGLRYIHSKKSASAEALLDQVNKP
jgi:hypothetical protein